jgi:tripartite-type tricarboxylate transporter receptor subunit TctC
MATPKVPEDRIAVLAAAFDKAFKDPTLWEQMEKVGEFLKLLSRPQIEQMVAKQVIEIDKYKDVLG